MRAAIVRLPDSRTANQRRQVLAAAIRQLDRADLYMTAVACMQIDDRDAQRAINKLRTDAASLRTYLAAIRAETTE